MSRTSRPMPVWLIWFCRILGALLIIGVIAYGFRYTPAVQATVKALRGGENFNVHTHGLVVAQVLGLLAGVVAGIWLLRRPGKHKPEAEAVQSPQAEAPVPTPAHHPAQLSPAKRWRACNVLQMQGDSRRIWVFDGGKFQLNRQVTVNPGHRLPAKIVRKSFTAIWRPQLNIACLPGDAVFFRPLQLPKAELAETRSMIEFQLEKISPLPVAQISWGILVLPSQSNQASDPQAEQMQTVLVIIVADSLVEELLGKLEQDGYFPDRLEVPLLDQLTQSGGGDGAWIYVDDAKPDSALVAWWQNGVLHNLGFLSLPAEKNDAQIVREQLTQMSWAGEIEGWLTKSPLWNLVVDGADVTGWQNLFAAAVGETVRVVPPLSAAELVAATARRAARANDAANLVPQEYTARYHQQFVDRLWMRGLAAVGLLYIFGVVIYMIALGFLEYQTRGVEKQVADQTPGYKNAVQARNRYQVMKERQDLKFAALDCWRTVAELLPQGAALETLDFKDGYRLTLRGSAAAEQKLALSDFNSAMRKAVAGPDSSRLMFKQVDPLSYSPGQNNSISWSFACELARREEAQP